MSLYYSLILTSIQINFNILLKIILRRKKIARKVKEKTIFWVFYFIFKIILNYFSYTSFSRIKKVHCKFYYFKNLNEIKKILNKAIIASIINNGVWITLLCFEVNITIPLGMFFFMDG